MAPSDLGLALLDLELTLSDLGLALLQKIDLELAPSDLGLASLELGLAHIDLELGPSDLGLASLKLQLALSHKINRLRVNTLIFRIIFLTKSNRPKTSSLA